MNDLNAPPHSIEAEQSILGAIMVDNRVIDQVADGISSGDFYSSSHRIIFDQIVKMDEANQPIDVVTLDAALAELGKNEDSGGLAYLGSIAKNTPAVGNVKAYVRIVKEKSIRRQIIEIGSSMQGMAYSQEGVNHRDILDRAESLIMGIAKSSQSKKETEFIGSVLIEGLDEIERRSKSKSKLIGLSSGFYDLDHITSGLCSGDLVVVAGRPSMGKTSFAMNIAEHVAINNQSSVGVFSMEMPKTQIGHRLYASNGRIGLKNIRTGQLSDDDWPKLTAATNRIKDTNLQINDTPALTVLELRSEARRMAKRTNGLDLIVIDYLQLMRDSNGSNRTEQISNITRSLKALALELNCPVICLSQLNRSLEQRPNKRPVMSDLRESGAIEQDADQIIFVYRDEVYNQDSEQKGSAEIIVSKNRNGELGMARLKWLGEFTKFDNFSHFTNN